MKYIVSYQKPNTHYIDIEYIIDNVNSEKIEIQLPAWRPGRYELANFAKNIQKWEAFDPNGKPLSSKKITKDLWEVETKGNSTIHIKYNYFANEINAGSSYLDDKQLYINGVNCFLYVPERINEECELELIIPKDYKVASGLKEITQHQFKCADFHQLVDSPLIASNSLQHHTYNESGVKFHLWFQGECKPNWKLLENDFRKFSKAQIEDFGDFGLNIGFRTGSKVDDDATVQDNFPVAGTEVQGLLKNPEDVNLNNEMQPLRLQLKVGLGAEYEISSGTAVFGSVHYNLGFTNVVKSESNHLLNDDNQKVTQKFTAHGVSISVGILF